MCLYLFCAYKYYSHSLVSVNNVTLFFLLLDGYSNIWSYLLKFGMNPNDGDKDNLGKGMWTLKVIYLNNEYIPNNAERIS